MNYRLNECIIMPGEILIHYDRRDLSLETYPPGSFDKVPWDSFTIDQSSGQPEELVMGENDLSRKIGGFTSKLSQLTDITAQWVKNASKKINSEDLKNRKSNRKTKGLNNTWWVLPCTGDGDPRWVCSLKGESCTDWRR